MALLLLFEGVAAAQGAAVNQESLIGGSSACPSANLVWQQLLLVVPSQVLADRLRVPGDPLPPVQIFDLGSSVRIFAGTKVRNFVDPTRDCARRAQVTALFVAVAAGADAMPSSSSPPAPRPVDIGAVPTPAGSTPPVARARLDVGASLGAAMGGGEVAIAPGLSLRLGLGKRRVVPVGALTVLAPFDDHAGGVAVRRWEAVVDADARVVAYAGGRSVVYVELGAAIEVLSQRPTNLALSRTQVSYAAGPRAATGLLFAPRVGLSPFFLMNAIWFPVAPELFALPAGDLGRAVWSFGATAGASWGFR